MNPLAHAGARCALSVNVNKVALLRNTRHLGIPSVTRAAQLCLEAGAHGITVHPRPDERHIRGSDVHELRAGYVTLTPLHFDLTETRLLQASRDFARDFQPGRAP